jgi:hypothetical protein
VLSEQSPTNNSFIHTKISEELSAFETQVEKAFLSFPMHATYTINPKVYFTAMR